MVSAVLLHPRGEREVLLESLGRDLAPGDRAVLLRALDFAEPLYAGQSLTTGEPVWPHALALAANLAAIGMDAASRAAGILFAAPKYLGTIDALRENFGAEIAGLAAGVEKLHQLRVSTRPGRTGGKVSTDEQEKQSEVLRKMVLGMVEDIRVVLIRLASRTQTLRHFAKNSTAEREGYAQESLDIYAPLANRLGMWQLKWEIEDLSLRFLDAEGYKRIAQMLDEKRAEREAFIRDVIAGLERELGAAGIRAEMQGRPKHIFSIYHKMRAKSLDFSEVRDVRAVRVIVDTEKDCYTALGIVHNLWTPIPAEFDDYISRPKANRYRSLHTAVIGPDGRALEVQIRTQEMHLHAEYGVAAHWRYKEGGAGGRAASPADSGFDEKIAWLRQLLAWRDEVADSAEWVESFKHAALDDTVYVMTPQGRVLDLPAGSTTVDFAYALHSDIGHRCRGAKVDGHMVPLDTPLSSGQRVEIISAKAGGPSRDWLNAELGYLKSHRAKQKVRQWFNAQALAETVASGRAIVEREMHREGEGRAKLDTLASTLGFAKSDEMFAAVARDEINLRQIQIALRTLVRGEPAEHDSQPTGPATHKSKSGGGDSGILVVGMEGLLTQLAGCCKPVPPDPIRGFVTRGRGVSIHREDCASFHNLSEKQPERVIDADWGTKNTGVFSVDMVVVASDRQGLLRDVGEALARDRINVSAVNTQSRHDLAYMRFTMDVADLGQLRRALAVVKEVSGVLRASRG